VSEQGPKKAAVTRRAFVAGSLAAATAACTSGSTRSGATSTSASPGTAPTTTAFAGGPAQFVVHGPRTREQVALTFHLSGDLHLVDQLLTIFSTRKVPVTAFVVGQWLDANPQVAQRLVADGHELANHTYTHLTFPSLPPAQMATEVGRCKDVLVRLAQTPGHYFRQSGTSDGVSMPSAAALTAAGDAGYATVIGFDVDPSDYADPGSALVLSRTVAQVKPGSIVSLHFGHQGTLDAMPTLLDRLQTMGLEPVTTSTLLRP
jgi:peptidoglycan/xylan/chitin deacetylase (PgdA/CDA1 family)